MPVNLGPILRSREMSQQALADALGISKGYVSEIVSGKKTPSIATATQMARILGVDIGFLLGHTEQVIPPGVDPSGFSEDSSPYDATPGEIEATRALFKKQSRDAVPLRQMDVDMPGLGLCKGDLLVCDMTRAARAGEIVAVQILQEPEIYTVIRRWLPPLLLESMLDITSMLHDSDPIVSISLPVIGLVRKF